MMSVVFGPKFLKAAQALPAKERERLAEQLERLTQDPFDPKLHSKKLSGPLAGLFSFRVGRDWRVLFQFLDPQTVQVIDVANRRDIYR